MIQPVHYHCRLVSGVTIDTFLRLADQNAGPDGRISVGILRKIKTAMLHPGRSDFDTALGNLQGACERERVAKVNHVHKHHTRLERRNGALYRILMHEFEALFDDPQYLIDRRHCKQLQVALKMLLEDGLNRRNSERTDRAFSAKSSEQFIEADHNSVPSIGALEKKAVKFLESYRDHQSNLIPWRIVVVDPTARDLIDEALTSIAFSLRGNFNKRIAWMLSMINKGQIVGRPFTVDDLYPVLEALFSSVAADRFTEKRARLFQLRYLSDPQRIFGEVFNGLRQIRGATPVRVAAPTLITSSAA